MSKKKKIEISPNVYKGLNGVYVDDSKISKIMPESNSLTYRGYAIEDLAENASFEEVAYLLWNGELPTQKELDDFKKKERSLRHVDDNVLDMLKKLPKNAHPMSVVRTAISFMGAQDQSESDLGPEALKEKSLGLMAKIPTIIAAYDRIRKGKALIKPNDNLDFSANFFHMSFGKVPKQDIIDAFDRSMIIYAEHTFNASTFSGRVTAATLSDIYSAATSATGTLKGPLHGGANEAVMHMLDEIGTEDKVEKWLEDAFAQKKKIMGFGHREYKKGDSRVPTLKKEFAKVARIKGRDDMVSMVQKVEDTMAEMMAKKGKDLPPNVDFPAGPMYKLMGFDTDMFTPFFVMARIVGWTAHIQEQLADNKLIRPKCTYSGPDERKVAPINKRGAGPKI